MPFYLNVSVAPFDAGLLLLPPLDSPVKGRLYTSNMQKTSSDCCAVSETAKPVAQVNRCPVCGQKGKSVKIITLKSLLKPAALATLKPELSYYFCSNKDCGVTYFAEGMNYETEDLKVAVFQKEPTVDVPACYCFNWTRARIADTVASGESHYITDSITRHIKAGRCGCEVNNPQGSCCLGNVRAAIDAVKRDEVKT